MLLQVERRQRTGANTTSDWIDASTFSARPDAVFEVAQISALTPFTSYQFRVRVSNEFGWGEFSEPSEFFTTLPNSK